MAPGKLSDLDGVGMPMNMPLSQHTVLAVLVNWVSGYVQQQIIINGRNFNQIESVQEGRIDMWDYYYLFSYITPRLSKNVEDLRIISFIIFFALEA